LNIGDSLEISIEGQPTTFSGRVRSIASNPSFTPYYALTGEDASRLVYRAEVVLEGPQTRQLPAGLPLQARLPQP
jgi:HlyD family secretion protein